MKIVVIGGTGLIGSKVTANLRQLGHEVIVAAPSTGVNTLTGEGLDEALIETDVVIDLSNSPSFDDQAVLNFFETSGENLSTAEIKAGVKQHVALSIVGADQMQDSCYMGAKVIQEDLVKRSCIPYTIVRSTQFFEFMAGIAGKSTHENEVHISDIKFQPIAAEDVAFFVTEFALSAPVNGITEIAGPDRFHMPDIIGQYLHDIGDTRTVVIDSEVGYFGAHIKDAELVPAGEANWGNYSYEAWLNSQLVKLVSEHRGPVVSADHADVMRY